MNHHIVGTKKWIGTTELATILNYLSIRTTIYDFFKPSGPNGTHPKLVSLVRAYFQLSSANGIKMCQLAPYFKFFIYFVKIFNSIYLQYQGHSKTIVGIGENQDGS